MIQSASARLKPLLENVLRKVAADEDELALALLAGFPRALTVAFDQHVDSLDDKALIVILHGNNAFHPQDVHPEDLRDVLNPRDELRRIYRLIGGEGQAGDLVVVFVIKRGIEKLGLDLKDAIE